MSRFLSYAQLLRLPNVFSAFADILMAGCVVGLSTKTPWLLLASGCLYLAGMVWNDLFDRHDDAKTQAFRPIPSGRVAVNRARVIGVVLIALGLLAAWCGRRDELSWISHANAFSVACVLTLAILLYDAILKRTPLGPAAMGACRFLNVMLGLTAGDFPWESAIVIAAIIGVYIIGVTWFARTEETTSQRWPLIAAAIVMLSALIHALTLPAWLSLSPWFGFPFGLVAMGFFVGLPIIHAIRSLKPKAVQMAVKRSIFGLVILDAVLATAFVGWPGLLIVLLLLPAIGLGKWVYST